MKIVAKLFKIFFNMIYALFKIFPVKDKVTFLSRQQDGLSIDYQLIQSLLKKRNPEVEVVSICKRFQDRRDGIMGFLMCLIRSVYHMATSKICVLDGYWPVACMLKHKKDLTIIQIWHSVGKIKKSGYQTLGAAYGRSKQIAELMDMHRNYDYVISGGKAWNRFYCEAFDIEEKILRNYGLPRMDKLIADREMYAAKVLEKYPEFKEKKVVLYAPTFRKNETVQWKTIADQFVRKDNYAFVCKLHPNEKNQCHMKGLYTCDEFSSMEVMAASDCVITDYSSLSLEAAALNKELYFYIYDIDEYKEKNGINLDVSKAMPLHSFKNPEMLFESIDKESYDRTELNAYQEKYLPEELGHSTEKIVKLIEEHLYA